MKETDRRILRILIPVILENALMMLSTMILTGYIGRLTVSEISYYGLQNRIYGIYYMLFKGIAVGVLVLIGAAAGRGDRDECHRLLKNSYAGVFPAAILLLTMVFFASRQILGIMTSDPELLDGAQNFLRQTMWFYPLMAVVALNASAFQANGNTRTPMIIAAMGNFVNISLGYVLIFGIGGIGGYGLRGAAMSQNISFVVMLTAGFFFLYGKRGLFEGKLLQFPDVHLPVIKEIYRVGIPASLESSAWQIATIFISRVILLYGKDTYAAYQLGLQAEGFCDIMSAGFMTAALSLSSNAIGARDYEAHRVSYRRLVHFGLIISVITMLYLALMSRFTLNLLTDKEELVTIALLYMRLMILSQIPQHLQKICAGYIRTAGYTKSPMLISMTGLWIVRVPLSILAGQILHLPVFWLWLIFDLDQWTRYTIALIMMKKYRILEYDDTLQSAYGS
ncbi:MAG: MATE family efflux transporter [Solobacterium sp.]|nr:MATE family efflux transporter [Solobacterium sp.]